MDKVIMLQHIFHLILIIKLKHYQESFFIRNNFPLDQPFTGKSSYTNEFKNYHLPKPLKNMPKNSLISSQAFPDQFKSTMKKDF